MIPPENTVVLAQLPLKRFYVSVVGINPKAEYNLTPSSVCLLTPGVAPGQYRRIDIARDPQGHPLTPTFFGRAGTRGQQLRGAATQAPLAIYHFQHSASLSPSGPVNFELRADVERGGASEADPDTRLSLEVHDLTTGRIAPPLLLNIESGRTAYFQLPGQYLQNGNFDVYLRCLTDGHWVGLYPASLALIQGQESFAYNLLKSLSVIWLLSLLVIIISVCSSTFLSWPIAIVFTLVLLLGHWGVTQLGDATSAGIGNQIATDFGFRDPANARVVSESVEALTRLLNTVSAVLPDISQFSATEDIERCAAIPLLRLWQALKVLLSFGLPVTVLAYLFLKNKEVAP